ncbi:MAG: NAD(P)-dependent oxidoreductase [Proteobacteria bacterium]|nr:NAD(P)-dependent oxidoreductase [Pseudomonadota bacterium]
MVKDIKKAGFIGLGDIGLLMAVNVVQKGFPTTIVGHRRREPIDEMKKLGAIEVGTPKELAQLVDVTIIMVGTDEQAEEVILGPNGLIKGIKPEDGVLLMGTYSPVFCRRVAEAARAKKADAFDAPVVGARMGAKAGTLGISVGGDSQNLERFRLLLETMGRITYCGNLGMGQVVKLANNICATVNAAVLAEAVNWGIRNGASEEMLVKHIQNGSGNSFVAQNWEWTRSMWTDPPPPTYYMGVKDMAHVLRIGLDVRQSCPFTALACEHLKGPPPSILPSPDA